VTSSIIRVDAVRCVVYMASSRSWRRWWASL